MTRNPLTVVVAAAFLLSACGNDSGTNEPAAPAAPPARPIASSACSPVTYGGPGRPQFLIAAVTSLQGQFKDHGVQTAQPLKLVLARAGWKAGPYRVGLQVCDEISASSDFADPKKCASNARAIARDKSVLAVVGPLFSGCVAAMLPVLANAPGGAVPVVSGSATYLGLTRSGPGVGPGEPAKNYGGGTRNFVRVVPADDVQGAAIATYLRDKSLSRAYVLSDRDPYGDGLAEAFGHAARKLGVEVTGTAHWNPKAKGYAALAKRIAGTRPDAVFIAGYVFENVPRLIKDLRTALPDALLVGPDGTNQPSTIVEGAGDAAENFLMTIAVVPARALPASGRAFAEDFRRRYSQLPCCLSVHAAQAALMVLDAIEKSGATRPKVRDALFGMRVNGGLVGDFSIDAFGDTTLTRIGLWRIEQGDGRFAGTLEPSANLLARG
jgi:branched-chain amino acid transport system substrate-binding protein